MGVRIGVQTISIYEEEKRMKKRVLSVLICMTMAVGMLPTMAHAASEGAKAENLSVAAPEKPAATQIPTSYMIYCTTEGSGHSATVENLIWDTFEIGEVTLKEGKYVQSQLQQMHM